MANDINAATVNAAQTASVATSDEAQAQPVATPFDEGTVKKFNLQVKRVQLLESENGVNVQLTFNKAIPGFVKKDGDYVPTDIDCIYISRSALTRALCEEDEMVATMRDGQETPLTRAQLSTILHGAILAITRTFHCTGYTREDGSAIDRDQWFTDIENVKLTEKADNFIEQLVMHRMMNE